MTEPMNNRRRYWRACYLAALLLAGLTFTPLVTPAHVYRPMLEGLPYTLWVGILVTVGLVVLTYVATRVYPVEDRRARDEP